MPIREIEQILNMINTEKNIIQNSEREISRAKNKLGNLIKKRGYKEDCEDWTIPIILLFLCVISLSFFSIYLFLQKPDIVSYVPIRFPVEKTIILNQTERIVEKPIINNIEQRIYEEQIIKADVRSDLLCITNLPEGNFTCFPKRKQN